MIRKGNTTDAAIASIQSGKSIGGGAHLSCPTNRNGCSNVAQRSNKRVPPKSGPDKQVAPKQTHPRRPTYTRRWSYSPSHNQETQTCVKSDILMSLQFAKIN